MNGKPPKWADRFLQWYCNPDLLEEIQGDAYELFFRRAEKSRRVASIRFAWDVVRFCPLRNIRKRKGTYRTELTSTGMLKSYFITGLRNIRRNLAPSLINIAGLSIALTCAV